MKIEQSVYDAVVKHLQSDTSIELCGYLCEKDGVMVKHVELTNVDNSIDHFTMDPKEQFGVIKLCRAEGLKPSAVYHSHPETPARPSQEDIRLAFDPTISYVIVSLAAETPDMKSFKIKAGEVAPEAVEVI
jgi:proteasome lid subunit RPN8/RPN11